MNMKKRGKFSISMKAVFYHDQALFNKMFKDIIVLRAEHMIVHDRIDYLAAGEAFDEIDDLEETPEYDCDFHMYKTKTGMRIRIKWVRKETQWVKEKLR